jgi:hypothetical protein
VDQIGCSKTPQYCREYTPGNDPAPALAAGLLEATKNDANNKRRLDAFAE